MILKSYEIQKANIDKINFILFYGLNQGAKDDEISQIINNNSNKTLSRYDEKEIEDNLDGFYENILSNSLFEKEKIILIRRCTDKILKKLEYLEEKNISDILIIIEASNLDKKSKLRSYFEKNKKHLCVAFYPDTQETLLIIANQFFKKNEIIISNFNTSILVNKCNGDRGILKNELNKIKFFTLNRKKLTSENLINLTNLIENYSIAELVDNCLAKNNKKIINILCDNNFNNEDSIIITRIFLQKAKRLLKLSEDYSENKDLNKTISNAKPPIFWKDKEIVKRQINNWNIRQIKELIFSLNDIELQIKKGFFNPVNAVSNFILEKSL